MATSAENARLNASRTKSLGELLHALGGLRARALNVGLDVVDVRALLVHQQREVLEDLRDLLHGAVDVGDVASVIGTTDNCAIVDTEPEVIANSIAEILRTEKRSNGRNSVTEMSVRTFAQSVANIYERLGTRKKPVELKSKIATFPAETKTKK